MSELKEIRRSLAQFYKTLMRGRMTLAKALWQQIPRKLNGNIAQIQRRPEYKEIYPEKAEKIDAYSGEYIVLRADILKMLNELPTEDEYKKDPPVWKGLLKSEYRKPVHKLMRLVRHLDRELKHFPIVTPVYTTKYAAIKQKSTYAANNILILKVEEKILDRISKGIFSEKLSGKIFFGEWKGFLHARLPAPIDNHRIVYSYDPSKRTVTFYTIGTHEELGLGTK